MIAHLSGVIAEKFGAGSVVIDVHGVGYEVSVSAGDFEAVALNQDIKFYTYHHVREQAEELFGFSSLAAKKLFEMLITVQGVGPKAALAILSLGDAKHRARARSAVRSLSSSVLSRVRPRGREHVGHGCRAQAVLDDEARVEDVGGERVDQIGRAHV